MPIFCWWAGLTPSENICTYG